MSQDGKIKKGDTLMLWGVILTMMGILGIIQMGVLEHLTKFIIYGAILVVVGIVLLVSLCIAEKRKPGF